jgi:hypothetical protein
LFGLITVGGNVMMEYNDALLLISEAKIRKNVVVEHNTVTAATGLFAEVLVYYSEIEGGVRLNNNSVSLQPVFTEKAVVAFGDHVGKNLEVSNNTVASPGDVPVGDNTVAGTLTCEGNEPPPEARQPNTAKKKLGQCELL